MGKPAARITDMHVCPMMTPGVPPIPHVGGPISMGSPTVLTGKLPQARVGDMAVCVGPPDVIAMGSTGVFVNKMPAARLGDQTAHGGAIVLGLPTVLIGEAGGGGGGGAGASMGNGSGFSAVEDRIKVVIDAAAQRQVDVAFAAVEAQIQTLAQAAVSGAPFCEVCFAEAVQNLKDALG